MIEASIGSFVGFTMWSSLFVGLLSLLFVPVSASFIGSRRLSVALGVTTAAVAVFAIIAIAGVAEMFGLGNADGGAWLGAMFGLGIADGAAWRPTLVAGISCILAGTIVCIIRLKQLPGPGRPF